MNRRNDVQAGLVTRLIPVLVLVIGGSAGGRMSLGVGESFPCSMGPAGYGQHPVPAVFLPGHNAKPFASRSVG